MTILVISSTDFPLITSEVTLPSLNRLIATAGLVAVAIRC